MYVCVCINYKVCFRFRIIYFVLSKEMRFYVRDFSDIYRMALGIVFFFFKCISFDDQLSEHPFKLLKKKFDQTVGISLAKIKYRPFFSQFH